MSTGRAELPGPEDADRDRPSDALQTAVRESFPTDPAGQQAIDQKLHRRGGPGWTPLALSRLVDGVRALLDERVGAGCEIREPRWLTGGASKIQMAFTVVLPGQQPRRMLLRMDPPETLNATNKSTEFEVLRAVGAVLPVPEAPWMDATGEFLPEPALICGFVDGVTKPALTSTGQVTGLGTNFGASLRPSLGADFVTHLAALHTLPVTGVQSPAVVAPRTGTSESALWRLNFERQLWELDRGEDVPLMDVAGGWLARTAPVLDRVSVVHGDYRSGNFLFDEACGRITAWLDWESCHLGDRHADLAYCTQPLYGHYAEDGETFLAGGLLPVPDLLRMYEEASGLSIDPVRLGWYSILCSYSAVVKTLATSYRVARLGRSHQDVLLARLEGTVPVLLQQLSTKLEEVL
ncbi:phosphotransferase family protein [Nakamurella alba]|uniref:phosphotransferase family protein n=1 Tax=Nakamurella alba TaxID=2665158 RepID=UPI002AC367AB|nr:phosphotransferase family protein [Nakamurella alba]